MAKAKTPKTPKDPDTRTPAEKARATKARNKALKEQKAEGAKRATAVKDTEPDTEPDTADEPEDPPTRRERPQQGTAKVFPPTKGRKRGLGPLGSQQHPDDADIDILSDSSASTKLPGNDERPAKRLKLNLGTPGNKDTAGDGGDDMDRAAHIDPLPEGDGVSDDTTAVLTSPTRPVPSAAPLTPSGRFVQKAVLSRKSPLSPPAMMKSKTPKKRKTDVPDIKESPEEDEAACAASHAKLKQYGIRVMSKKLDKAEDFAAITGYLGFDNTGMCAAHFKKTAGTLDGLIAARKLNYGIVNPDTKNATKEYTITKNSIFEQAKKCETLQLDRELLHLKTIDLNDVPWSNMNHDHSLAVKMWTAQIAILIRRYPDVFVDTDDPKYTGPRYGQMAIEDFFRGWCYIRGHILAVAEGKNYDKYPGLKTAVPLRWFGGNDNELGTGKTKRGGVYGTRDAYRASAPGSTTLAPRTKLQHALLGERNLRPLTHINLSDKQSVVEGRRRLNARLEDAMDNVNSDDAGDEDSADPLDQFLHELFAHTSTESITRDPIDEEELKAFLMAMGQQADVQHDQFPAVSAKMHELQSDSRIGVGAAEVAGMNADLAHADAELTKQFISLRNKVAAPGDNIPTFAEAAAELNYDEDEISHGREGLRDEGSPFLPEAVQVVGAAFMKRMEDSPVKGGLLALDTGLGKTLTVLYYLVRKSLEIEAAYGRGEQPACRPTLVICPPPVITGWFKEISTYFKDKLQVRYMYSSQDQDQLPVEQRDLCLPVNPEECRLHLLQHYRETSPHSARTVVLTTYETFVARYCRQVPRGINKVNLEAEGLAGDERVAELMAERVSVEDVDDIDDQEGEKGGIVDDSTFDYMMPLRGFFGRMVLDEGHRIKNSRSKIHRTVFNSFAEYHWIVSATPLMNRSSDLHGYLPLYYRKSFGIGQWTTFKKNPGEWMYNPAERARARDEFAPECGEYGSTIIGWHKPTPLDLFILDPVIFARMANKNLLTGEGGRECLGSILSLLQLKITMATPLDVNGVMVNAGSNVKPYQSVVVELGSSEYESRQLKNIWDIWYPKLYIGGNTKDAVGQSSLRNGAIHRLLMVIASDIRLFHVLAQAHGRSEDVKRWATEYDDRGASHYFNLTRSDPTMLPYATRWEMAAYIAALSPKLRYLCRLIYRARYTDANDDELAHKLLIFCNWPVEQWLVAFFLDLLGLGFSELKSGQAIQDKVVIMKDFNDKTSQTRVCVTSFKNTAVGVNMHEACHRIVMISVPENVNTLQQCIGRVHRLGQNMVQLIWILGLERTYDIFLQEKVSTKFHGEILAHAQLKHYPWAPDELDQLKATVRSSLREGDEYLHALRSARRKVEDQYLEPQVAEIIGALLGFRRVRVPLEQNPELLHNPKTTDDVDGDGERWPMRVAPWLDVKVPGGGQDADATQE